MPFRNEKKKYDGYNYFIFEGLVQLDVHDLDLAKEKQVKELDF